MRLIDLARPYLDGIDTIVEVAAGDLHLRPHLRDAGDAAYVRCEPGTDIPAVGKGVLLVLAMGPDPAWHLPARVCRQMLERVSDGGRGLVLFGYPSAELPYHQILDSLVAHRCQVLQAATLDYPVLPCGIAFAQAEDVQAPPDYFGRPVVTKDASLRIANEHVLAAFVSRGLRARYQDMARKADTAGMAGVGLAEHASLTADNERLARALSEAEQQTARAEMRLTAVERSATMEVGRLFVAAAQRPWRGTVRLPRGLHGVWRRRGAAAPRGRLCHAGGAAGGQCSTEQAARAPRGGWAWRPATPDGLVIAGLLTRRTFATLAPDAAVHPLLPHDPALVLEGTGADIMIIDAAAARPGGPWSYIGDPAAADRGGRLAGLIAVARSLGIPVVFLRSLAPWQAPGLEVVAARCDAVFEGDLGVQLARFNPVNLDPLRSCDPVYAGCRDPREPPAQRRLLDAPLGVPQFGAERSGECSGAGLLVVPGIPWHAQPGLYRRHGLFVTASSPRQAREQLACGARVIGPVGSAEPVAGAVHVRDAADAATQIAAARQQGAREPDEIRRVLRELFTTHATLPRLAELARLAGVSADPLAARKVAVLVNDAVSAAAAAGVEYTGGTGRAGDGVYAWLASAVLRQRHRPGEVVLAMPGTAAGAAVPGHVPAALRELTDVGIAVRLAREPGLAGAARAARLDWLVPWDTGRDYPDTYLLDLVCAQECSRADVVGAAGAADGAAYVFAQDLAPALARRELLSSAEPRAGDWSTRAGDWSRRGHTLFAISGRH